MPASRRTAPAGAAVGALPARARLRQRHRHRGRPAGRRHERRPALAGRGVRDRPGARRRRRSSPRTPGVVARLLRSPVAGLFAAAAGALAGRRPRPARRRPALRRRAAARARDGAAYWWHSYLEPGTTIGIGSGAPAAPYLLPLAMVGSLLAGQGLAARRPACSCSRCRSPAGAPSASCAGSPGSRPMSDVGRGRLRRCCRCSPGRCRRAGSAPSPARSCCRGWPPRRSRLGPAADRRPSVARRLAHHAVAGAAGRVRAARLGAAPCWSRWSRSVAGLRSDRAGWSRRSVWSAVLTPLGATLVLLLPWTVTVWFHQGPSAWLFEAGLPAPDLTEPLTRLDVVFDRPGSHGAPAVAVVGRRRWPRSSRCCAPTPGRRCSAPGRWWSPRWSPRRSSRRSRCRCRPRPTPCSRSGSASRCWSSPERASPPPRSPAPASARRFTATSLRLAAAGRRGGRGRRPGLRRRRAGLVGGQRRRRRPARQPARVRRAGLHDRRGRAAPDARRPGGARLAARPASTTRCSAPTGCGSATTPCCPPPSEPSSRSPTWCRGWPTGPQATDIAALSRPRRRLRLPAASRRPAAGGQPRQRQRRDPGEPAAPRRPCLAGRAAAPTGAALPDEPVVCVPGCWCSRAGDPHRRRACGTEPEGGAMSAPPPPAMRRTPSRAERQPPAVDAAPRPSRRPAGQPAPTAAACGAAGRPVAVRGRCRLTRRPCAASARSDRCDWSATRSSPARPAPPPAAPPGSRPASLGAEGLGSARLGPPGAAHRLRRPARPAARTGRQDLDGARRPPC